MNPHELQVSLYFLKRHQGILETFEENPLPKALTDLFTDEQLKEILLWIYPEVWKTNKVAFMPREQVINNLESDYNVLSWMIHKATSKYELLSKCNQETVNLFFEITQQQQHYLALKPVYTWDAYDHSNYKSLQNKRTL